MLVPSDEKIKESVLVKLRDLQCSHEREQDEYEVVGCKKVSLQPWKLWQRSIKALRKCEKKNNKIINKKTDPKTVSVYEADRKEKAGRHTHTHIDGYIGKCSYRQINGYIDMYMCVIV